MKLIKQALVFSWFIAHAGSALCTHCTSVPMPQHWPRAVPAGDGNNTKERERAIFVRNTQKKYRTRTRTSTTLRPAQTSHDYFTVPYSYRTVATHLTTCQTGSHAVRQSTVVLQVLIRSCWNISRAGLSAPVICARGRLQKSLSGQQECCEKRVPRHLRVRAAFADAGPSKAQHAPRHQDGKQALQELVAAALDSEDVLPLVPRLLQSCI